MFMRADKRLVVMMPAGRREMEDERLHYRHDIRLRREA